jgi:hypothetical protein
MILALLLLFLAPSDGGNHPRKEEMSQPQRGFHPPKAWDN